jgi:hypothetical protein
MSAELAGGVAVSGPTVGSKPHTQPAASAPPASENEAAKRPVKYPVKYHLSITVAMNDALARLSGDNSLATGAQIGRMALHQFLMANDPLYARQMGVVDRRQER